MPEQTEIEAYHADMDALFIDLAKLGEESNAPTSLFETVLDQDFRLLMDDLTEQFRAGTTPAPAVAFSRAMHALDAVDARRFMLENLLEEMKRSKADDDGAEMWATLRHYGDLGLIKAEVPECMWKPCNGLSTSPPSPAEDAPAAAGSTTTPPTTAPPSSPAPTLPPVNKAGSWDRLRGWFGRLKKVGLKLAEIAVRAAKAMGTFVGVKPLIGLTGPLPSLAFEIELRSASLTEVFNAFAETVWDSGGF